MIRTKLVTVLAVSSIAGANVTTFDTAKEGAIPAAFEPFASYPPAVARDAAPDGTYTGVRANALFDDFDITALSRSRRTWSRA